MHRIEFYNLLALYAAENALSERYDWKEKFNSVRPVFLAIDRAFACARTEAEMGGQCFSNAQSE